MPEKNIYSTATTFNKYSLESKKIDVEAGLCGKFFGAKGNAQTNIAGLVLLVLVVSGITVPLCTNELTFTQFWQIAGPIVTTLIGFIIGKRVPE